LHEPIAAISRRDSSPISENLHREIKILK